MKPLRVAANEVFEDGSLLRTVYGPPHSLWLWHWAFREGKPIELLRTTKLEVVEIAAEYWTGVLKSGYPPPAIRDAHGGVWERLWKRLEETP